MQQWKKINLCWNRNRSIRCINIFGKQYHSPAVSQWCFYSLTFPLFDHKISVYIQFCILYAAWIRWPSDPNFSGQSRILRACPEKNTRSFGTLNCPKFRTLSRICPDLTSRCIAVQAVDQNAVDHFDVFACQEMCSVELKMHKIHFLARAWPQPRWGSLRRSPIDPIVGWRGDREGDTPPHMVIYLSPSTPSASRSQCLRRPEKCPEFLS